MCGIAGEFRFDGADAAVYAHRAVHVLARRGPDFQGVFTAGAVALCHTRMSIIDLSDDSNQPMTDLTTGLTLVFNGTIYNYRELRDELRALGHRFTTSGDTEVILKAYAQWGRDCVTRFNGVFAFAIWSARDRELFLARDHLGVKPLYYSLDSRRLVFASNPQTLLLADNVDTSIDAKALHHHLTLHGVVPAPDTVLQGVKKVAPAQTLTLNASGKVASRTYWQLAARRPDTPLTENQWREKIEHLLVESVVRRYEITDVPIGVLLSGGLDSSLIFAILKRAGKDARAWSIGFEHSENEVGDEFHYSNLMIERYAAEHKKITFNNRELVDLLPDAIAQMPEPMVSQDSVAFYALAREVRRDIRVAQCGQGADELFGGYFWYPPLMEHAQRDAAAVDLFRKHYFDRAHAEFLAAVTPDYHTPDVTTQTITELFDSADADTFIDAVWQTDMTTLIVDDPIKRVDSMTMAWGLEARVPFLDVALVEAAMQMPPELKVARQNGTTIGKYLLKQIAGDLVPDEIIHREKAYFPVPMLKHLDARAFNLARDALLSDACRERGLFEREYIDRLLQSPHLTPIRGNKLWHHALLEMWLQTHVDGANAATGAADQNVYADANTI